MRSLPQFYRGLDLRAEREMRGLTLEELAQASKYSVRQLQDFEAGRYERLPSDVFIRGIVRMFIQKLGLDPEMVHLEYLHYSEQATRKEKDDSNEEPLKQNLWTMQVGPVAGFFVLTCLVMVLLWPEKDFEIQAYFSMTPVDKAPVKVNRQTAEECLDSWSIERINLMNEPGLLKNVFTISKDIRVVKITTSEANWVRIQDMRTGTERLQGLFPGASFTFTLHDETIMWFDRPGKIALYDNDTDVLIKEGPPAVIRFLPMKNLSIMHSEEQA